MRVICYLIIVLLIYSCGSGGSPSTYEQVSLLEYNIKSKSKRVIKAFGENETSPYVRYFNKTNGFVYGRYSQFNVFDETGKEKIVKIDSMLIGEFFSISPDDKDLIFCATIHTWSPSTADVYRDRGLYRLNLETYAVSLIYKDSLEVPQYPIYSNNGGLILFKTSAYQGWSTHIYIINRNGENKVKIASNDFGLLKYGFFNSDDTKLYFLECPDKVYQYDIINKKLEAIINSRVFDGSVSYPFINIHGNYLYFYTQYQDSIINANSLYTLDLTTKEIKLFPVTGMPMSFSKNYALITTNPLSLISLIDSSCIRIDAGIQGDISYDESKVVYLRNEIKYY